MSGIFNLSRTLLKQPKQPTNVFFPNYRFELIKAARYKGRRVVCFKVHKQITKPEIKEYLKKIYKAKPVHIVTYIRIPDAAKTVSGVWYRPPIYKRAHVYFEESVDPRITHIDNTRNNKVTPILTGPANHIQSTYKFNKYSDADMNRHNQAWMEPIPLLLRGHKAHPKLRNYEKTAIEMDHTKPFNHYGPKRVVPAQADHQPFQRINIAKLRADRLAWTQSAEYLKLKEKFRFKREPLKYMRIDTPDMTNKIESFEPKYTVGLQDDKA